MFIPPPLLLLGAIGISLLLSKLSPLAPLVSSPTNLVGLVLIAGGIGLFLWTTRLFKHHKTTLHPKGKPSSLITAGPYRFTRNPIYVGFLLISLGAAIFFANILALVGPIVFFFFINTFIIPFEEQMLGHTFGEKYHSYRTRTRRWI